MMKSNKQAQKSGNGSLNIQAGHDVEITSGLSYEDAKNIALDVFQANFYKLVGIAQETAKQRAEEITDKFLTELQKRNPEGLKNAKDVDFQHSLFVVQKEYARTGDKDLGDILVDILVDRSKEDERSILQIVLNESLQIAPKLTPNQIATLTVIFTLRHTKFLRMDSLESLKDYIDHRISPFVSSLSVHQALYQHLVYAGCGSISIGQTSIEKLFRATYPGLFSKGFSSEEIKELGHPINRMLPLFAKSLHSEGLFQLPFLDEDILKQTAKKMDLTDPQVDKLLSLQNKYLMSEKELKEYLLVVHPCMKKLFDVWGSSPLKNTSLTSVGIAIGHANMRRVTGESADLAIWIN